MALSSKSSIPRLKSGITITPYQDAMDSAPRFLLALGDSYFLISSKARALVIALQCNPVSNEQFEVDFEAESNESIPAIRLLALANKILPAALFSDTPIPTRETPFIISFALMPAVIAARVTAYVAWLFAPRLAILIVTVFAVLHIFVLPEAARTVHSIWSARDLVELATFFMLSGLIHEVGHTAACRYFKCPHGAIGVGLYFIFPVWYADVTKAWRLKRGQRAVVDIGGVYFQSIFLIAVDAYALSTGSHLAFKLAWLITFAMLFTLNPVFKFDGYWLLSDLSGCHNLHKQVRQLSAAFIASLISKHTVIEYLGRSRILYAYAALSFAYFVYFGSFLMRELSLLGDTLVPKLTAEWCVLVSSSFEQGWQVVIAIGAFCGLLLWPVIIVLASIFFLSKLFRSVLEIINNVQMARTIGNGRSLGEI